MNKNHKYFNGQHIQLSRQWERVKIAAVVLIVFYLFNNFSN